MPLTVTGEASPLALEAVQETVGAPLSKLHEATLKDTSFLHSASPLEELSFLTPIYLLRIHQTFVQTATPFLSHYFTGKNRFWHSPSSPYSALHRLCGTGEKEPSISHDPWKKIGSISPLFTHNARKKWLPMPKKRDLSLTNHTLQEELVGQGEWLLADVEKRALFPLHPDVPRLSDFLLWLGERIEEAQKDEGSGSLFI